MCNCGGGKNFHTFIHMHISTYVDRPKLLTPHRKALKINSTCYQKSSDLKKKTHPLKRCVGIAIYAFGSIFQTYPQIHLHEYIMLTAVNADQSKIFKKSQIMFLLKVHFRLLKILFNW